MDDQKSAVCKVPADSRETIDTVWLKKITEKEATKYAKDYYKNLVSLVNDFLESKEYEHFEHTNARVLSTRECSDVDVDIGRSFGMMLKHRNTGEKAREYARNTAGLRRSQPQRRLRARHELSVRPVLRAPFERRNFLVFKHSYATAPQKFL